MFALGVASLLVLCGCASKGGGSASEGEKAADVEVLNTALSQELTAIEAYGRGLPLLHGEALAVARRFRVQEQEHADAVTKAIRGLGGKSDGEANPLDYSGLKTRADFLALAYKEENALIAFYMNAIPKLETSAPGSLLATIVANESEHLVVIRQALGARPTELVPDAFETGDSAPPAE
jgi:bacterioferritin (cytochrome b1)